MHSHMWTAQTQKADILGEKDYERRGRERMLVCAAGIWRMSMRHSPYEEELLTSCCFPGPGVGGHRGGVLRAWALTEPWRNCREEVKVTGFPRGVRSQRRKWSVPHPTVGMRAGVTRTGFVQDVVLRPGLPHDQVCGRPRGTEEHSGQREQQAEQRRRDGAACPGARE